MYAATNTWLSRIETSWTLVAEAHGCKSVRANSAMHGLLDRYRGAAWRYLLAVTRNETAAEDLFQEFALRLIRGDFRRADRKQGRFRDYLKTVLINLLNDFHRCRTHSDSPLPVQVPAPATNDLTDDKPDVDFLASWRAELLQRTWAALEGVNGVYYAVLRTQVRYPDATAAEKAQHVARQIGESFTSNHYRVTLHRAREKFSQLLQREVADTLGSPTPEELHGELRQLRLSRYCGQAA